MQLNMGVGDWGGKYFNSHITCEYSRLGYKKSFTPFPSQISAFTYNTKHHYKTFWIELKVEFQEVG